MGLATVVQRRLLGWMLTELDLDLQKEIVKFSRRTPCGLNENKISRKPKAMPEK